MQPTVYPGASPPLTISKPSIRPGVEHEHRERVDSGKVIVRNYAAIATRWFALCEIYFARWGILDAVGWANDVTSMQYFVSLNIEWGKWLPNSFSSFTYQDFSHSAPAYQPLKFIIPVNIFSDKLIFMVRWLLFF